MRFPVLVLIYLYLTRYGFCFFLRTSETLEKTHFFRGSGINFSAWIFPTPRCPVVWSYCRPVSGKGMYQRSWLTPNWRRDLLTSAAPIEVISCSSLTPLPPPTEGHQPTPPGAANPAAQGSLLPDTAPPKTEKVSSVSSADTSTGGIGEIQSVEIDATLDGISREGLLQLLQELQQQTPELLRLLPTQNTSSLESLSTKELRGLVEQLLNLAEAADVHGNPDRVSVNSQVSSTSPSGSEMKSQRTQAAPQPQPQKKQEDSRDQQRKEKRKTREREQNDLPQKDSGAGVPVQSSLSQAAATATAAASAAAVEAQQLLEMGFSEEEGEGLFSALQEQLPVLPESDILDLLVTMGPVLQALLPPESSPQDYPSLEQHQRQKNEQQGSTVDSVRELLDATAQERQALAAEGVAIRRFVEAKVEPLSWEARKDLLLTLLAVAEAEAYCPKEPEVRQLLGLDDAGAVVTSSASAAGAAADRNGAEQSDSRAFGGLPVVSAWRRLLQLPENALRGENSLSAEEADALSVEEVKLRYSRVIKQAKEESIKASIKRCEYKEQDESSVEGPELPAESLVGTSASQRTIGSKPPTKASSAKPQDSEDSKHSVRQLSDSDCLGRRLNACSSAPTTGANLGAAVRDSIVTASSASESPMGGKEFQKAVIAAGRPSSVVRPASVGVSIGKNSSAIQSGRGDDPPIQEGDLLDPSRKPEKALGGHLDAEDSGDTSDWRRLRKLPGGAGRFAALGLNDVVSSAAAAFLGGTAPRPTPTQRLVVPPILEVFKKAERKSGMMVGKSSVDSLVALWAHTGSGKTLAFLLPLMQALREQEAAATAAAKRSAKDEVEYADLMDCKALAETLEVHRGAHRALFGARGPRALVICPSRPLASQVASVAAALAKRIRLSVGCTTGGVGTGDQLRLLRRRPVDILIGTPDRLLCLTRPNPMESRTCGTGERIDRTQRTSGRLVSLENVQFCILDEADASWLGGFRDDVEKLLLRSHFLHAVSQPVGEQETRWVQPKVLLTCTATPNSGVEGGLCELLELPAERVLTLSGGPSFPPQTQLCHEMMQARGADRFLLLVEQIKIHPQLRGKKILVFCNTVDSCRACCHHLQAADLPAEVPVR